MTLLWLTEPGFVRGKVMKNGTVIESKRYVNKASEGPWEPANGGSEEPFVSRSGRVLLYVWQPATGRHAYLDCQTDSVLSDDEALAHIGV